MAAIQSSDFVPQFSDDAGVTWQTLICPTSWNADGSSEVTKTSTLTCGVLSAPGAFGYECSADAIADKNPTSTQVSVEQIQDWAVNGTELMFKAAAGTLGADLYMSGDSRISGLTITSEADDYLKFSVTWTVENLDIVP